MTLYVIGSFFHALAARDRVKCGIFLQFFKSVLPVYCAERAAVVSQTNLTVLREKNLKISGFCISNHALLNFLKNKAVLPTLYLYSKRHRNAWTGYHVQQSTFK
jgi:hypothetical protein